MEDLLILSIEPEQLEDLVVDKQATHILFT